MTVDTNNELTHHLAVGIGSVVFAALLWVAGYHEGRVAGAVPWFLLVLVLIVGPTVRLWPGIRRRFSGNFPVNWRAELGIWFAIWSVVHLLFVFQARNWDVVGYLSGMSPWAFGSFVAVIITVGLAATSNNRAYDYMGGKAWKWHQTVGAYAIFWLLAVHIYDRAYLRPGFPPDDPLHWLYLLTLVLVVVLQIAAFAKVVSHYRETGEYPSGLN